MDKLVTDFVFFCVFVQLKISTPRIKLAASNVARWFVGVLGRESPNLGNFVPPEAQNWTNRPATEKYCLGCISLPHHKRHATDVPFMEYHAACGHRLACVDISQCPLMYLLYFHLQNQLH